MKKTGPPVLNRSVRSFLNAPRIARLCTLGPDGYPHVVPIYFMRDGDEIVFGSDNGEQKVCNAFRNPKSAVIIGGEPGADEAGYMIQGDLTVENDPEHTLVQKMLYRYEAKKEAEEHLAEWANSDMVLIRMQPRKVIRVW
jgi:PPOX class probable F420-dependent enzyme